MLEQSNHKAKNVREDQQVPQVVKSKRSFWSSLKSILSHLIVFSAIAVLLAHYVFPVYRIYSDDMMPTLSKNSFVLAVKEQTVNRYDLVAFYRGRNLHIFRVIGLPGEDIDFNDEGDVFVNGKLLPEQYITEASKEPLDIQLPYTVPEQSYFVLADHRSEAADSRRQEFGPVSAEDVVGVIKFTLWQGKGD